MQPGLSLDDIIARKRAQVKAKKSGKIVEPVEEEKEVNEDDESGKGLAGSTLIQLSFFQLTANGYVFEGDILTKLYFAILPRL